jgi:hypothetical protein
MAILSFWNREALVFILVQVMPEPKFLLGDGDGNTSVRVPLSVKESRIEPVAYS